LTLITAFITPSTLNSPISADIRAACSGEEMKIETALNKTPVRIPHITNWVIPTKPIPTIFPTNKFTGLTEETITSTTLLFFSSSTACITMFPYIRINI